jgi:hypothetical protein
VTTPALSETERLRSLLAMYAETNDCPVCLAVPKMVDVDVEQRGNVVIHRHGRWHVEHGLSCDVGRALRKRRATPKRSKT